jgi:hypothetical protein
VKIIILEVQPDQTIFAAPALSNINLDDVNMLTISYQEKEIIIILGNANPSQLRSNPPVGATASGSLPDAATVLRAFHRVDLGKT